MKLHQGWKDVTEANSPCDKCIKCRPTNDSAIWITRHYDGKLTIHWWKYVDGTFVSSNDEGGEEEVLPTDDIKEAKELALTLWRLG